MSSGTATDDNDAKARARSGREKRLAEALRANLKRRKAWERRRAVLAAEGGVERDERSKEPG
jgi:hypothetical protein